MSEEKKVIHVKDLVIKAENVRIEPAHRPDPIFGGRKHDEKKREDNVEDKHDHDSKHDHNDKPPFSWV